MGAEKTRREYVRSRGINLRGVRAGTFPLAALVPLDKPVCPTLFIQCPGCGMVVEEGAQRGG